MKLVGAFVAIQPPATLTCAQTDAYLQQCRRLSTQSRRRRQMAPAMLGIRPSSEREATAGGRTYRRSCQRATAHLLVVDGGQEPATVRAVVRYRAYDLAECRRRVPETPASWSARESQLRDAASGWVAPGSPVASGVARLDLQRCGDVDGRHQGTRDGAVPDMRSEHAFDRCAFVGVVEFEVVGHVDPFEDQDLVLLLDLALGDSDEPVSA